MGKILGASSRNPPSAHGPIPPLAGAGLAGGPSWRLPSCMRPCHHCIKRQSGQKEPQLKRLWLGSICLGYFELLTMGQ